MPETLLSAAKLANYLGFAPGTIVDWAEKGTVPAFKLGGRWRFRLDEVEAWLEGQRLTGRGREEKLTTTPTVDPARGVVLQVTTTPLEGEEGDA